MTKEELQATYGPLAQRFVDNLINHMDVITGLIRDAKTMHQLNKMAKDIDKEEALAKSRIVKEIKEKE